ELSTGGQQGLLYEAEGAISLPLSSCIISAKIMAGSRSLVDRAALVTGATTGVGKGIALELALAGCRVAVNYLDDEKAAACAVEELAALGVEAFAVQADVRSSFAVRAMIDRVVERLGRLDILVNNAGVQTWAPLLE